MENGKKLQFIINDEQFGHLVMGNLDELLRELVNQITPDLEELEDGETFELTITRKDMTQKEIDSTPEI